MTTDKLQIYENIPDLLTPEEAAAYIHMSKQYVYREVRAGNIRGKKLGNKWRIPKKELIRILHDIEGDLYN